MNAFYVYRPLWLRGKGYSGSQLYTGGARASMCCLGMVGEQCGIPMERLLHQPQPSSFPLRDESNKFPRWLFNTVPDFGDITSQDAYWCMAVNDSVIGQRSLPMTAPASLPLPAVINSEAEREGLLSQMFALHGCSLNFVG